MNDFEQLLQMDREQLMKALAHKANTRRLLGIDGDNDVVKFEYHNAKYVYRQDGTIVMLDIYVEREDTELFIPADVDHVYICHLKNKATEPNVNTYTLNYNNRNSMCDIEAMLTVNCNYVVNYAQAPVNMFVSQKSNICINGKNTYKNYRTFYVSDIRIGVGCHIICNENDLIIPGDGEYPDLYMSSTLLDDKIIDKFIDEYCISAKEGDYLRLAASNKKKGITYLSQFRVSFVKDDVVGIALASAKGKEEMRFNVIMDDNIKKLVDIYKVECIDEYLKTQGCNIHRL